MFEAFAGIGAQASALERLNINYEIVGISEWFIDAIECYAAIHKSNEQIEIPFEKQEVMDYLKNFTFSIDSVHRCNIDHFTEDKLRNLCRANKNVRIMAVLLIFSLRICLRQIC